MAEITEILPTFKQTTAYDGALTSEPEPFPVWINPAQISSATILASGWTQIRLGGGHKAYHLKGEPAEVLQRLLGP